MTYINYLNYSCYIILTRCVNFWEISDMNNNFCHNCHTAETKFLKNISVMCHAELRLISFFSENDFCKIDIIYVKTHCIKTEKQKYLCHAVFVRLRLIPFFSDNNSCKVDVISVKTGCIMSKKKYGFTQFCHRTVAELRQSAFFSENNLCKIGIISVKMWCIWQRKSIGFHINIPVMQKLIQPYLSILMNLNQPNLINVPK